MLTQRVVSAALVGALATCDPAVGPGEGGEAVIVSSEEQHLRVVQVSDARILARPAPAPPGAYGFARSLDSTIVYYAGSTTYQERQILALDVRSLKVLWNHRLADLEQRSHVTGVGLSYATAITPSPDGTRLFVAQGYLDGVPGVAVLDGATREPIDFIAPLAVPTDGMALVPPSAVFPDGAIAITGSREQGLGPKSGWVFFADPKTLALRDSVQLTRDVDSRSGGLGQVELAPHGRVLYVAGPGALLRYDFTTRVTDSARAVPGRLSIAADGTVYTGDSGLWDRAPSTGLLFRYSADLSTVDSIDLGEAAVDGFGPTVQDVAPSRDERIVYVLIGNARLGVGQFPGQPKRVLVVDVQRKAIAKSLPLGDWSGVTLFVR